MANVRACRKELLDRWPVFVDAAQWREDSATDEASASKKQRTCTSTDQSILMQTKSETFIDTADNLDAVDVRVTEPVGTADDTTIIERRSTLGRGKAMITEIMADWKEKVHPEKNADAGIQKRKAQADSKTYSQAGSETSKEGD